MRVSTATWIAAALVVASAALALWAWLTLPAGAGVPLHILGTDGVRRLVTSRAALWLMPLVAATVTLGLTFGSRGRLGAELAPEVFDITIISVAGLLLVVETALITRAFETDFNVMRPVAIATSVLLLAVGNYLGKARQNAFIGLRTPWTLANAAVWDKTHRFTGRGMVLGGLLLMALGFFLHDANLLGVSIAVCTAVPLLLGVARSLSLYRRLQRG